MSDHLVHRFDDSVRARTRPVAVLGMWAWETVLALLAAWPAATLARGAYGRYPSGDAALWDPGALPLLGLLTRETNGGRMAGGAVVGVLLLAAVAGLVPLAALLATLAYTTAEGDRIGAARAIGRGVGAFRPFVRMLLLVLLGAGMVALAAVLLGEGVQGWTRGWLGEARSQQAALVAGGLVALPLLALWVVQDLGRAAVIRQEIEAMHGLTVGTRTLVQAPLALGWAWGWRALLSLGLLLAGGALAGGLGGRGGWALLVLLGVHQSVVLGRVALRASWLARALRAVGHFASDR